MITSWEFHPVSCPKNPPLLPVPSPVCALPNFPQTSHYGPPSFNNDPGLAVSSDHPGPDPAHILHRRATFLVLVLGHHRLHRRRISRALCPLLVQRFLAAAVVLLLSLLGPARLLWWVWGGLLASVDGILCSSCRRGRILLGKIRRGSCGRASWSSWVLEDRSPCHNAGTVEAWSLGRCAGIDIHL